MPTDPGLIVPRPVQLLGKAGLPAPGKAQSGQSIQSPGPQQMPGKSQEHSEAELLCLTAE